MAIAEPKSLAIGILRYQQQVKTYVPQARCRMSRDGMRYEIIDPTKGKEININLWGIDGKTRGGEAIASVPFKLRDPGALIEYRAWQAAARKLTGEWDTVQSTGLDLSDIQATILGRAVAPSQSTPGKSYELVRTPSGWNHVDTSCTAWVTFNDCNHIRRPMATEQIETTALATISGDVLARIEELEDVAIIQGLTGSITQAWAYSFPVSGKTINGLSSKGVEEAGREMAKMGEALREIDVRLDYEDETEARFIAKAGRYAISGGGQETMLDSAIRGKRQPKFMTANGRKVFDENWYEKGVTKANRNAKDALIPNTIRAHIIAEAAKAGRVQSVPPQPQSRSQERRYEAQSQRPPQARPENGTKDASTRFWAVANRRGANWWEPILREHFSSTDFALLNDDEKLRAAELVEAEDVK